MPSALMCCLDERFSPKPFLDINYKYQTLEGEGQRSETPFLNEHFLPYRLFYPIGSIRAVGRSTVPDLIPGFYLPGSVTGTGHRCSLPGTPSNGRSLANRNRGKQWMPWQGGRFPVEVESWVGRALLGFLPEHL